MGKIMSENSKSKCGICGRMVYEDCMVNDKEAGLCCLKHFTVRELMDPPILGTILDELDRAKKIHIRHRRDHRNYQEEDGMIISHKKRDATPLKCHKCAKHGCRIVNAPCDPMAEYMGQKEGK